MLFQAQPLSAKAAEVVGRIEELRQALKYATIEPRRWTGLLRRATFARAIRGSNSIEGYTVELDDAVAAVEGEEPLTAEGETLAAVKGYRDAMTYILQLANDPHFAFSEGLLRSLHFMMTQYDLSKSPGRWRSGPVYVRNEATGQNVYEGVEAERIPPLMSELIEQLQVRDNGTPVLVRAGLAHLNLVMIHPFKDGNGRMARALQTLVLAREGILSPEFCSIEEYLGKNTLDYYEVLALVGGGRWQPHRDSDLWTRFTLTAHFRQALTLLRRMREAERLWDLLEEEIQRRKLPDRLVLALFDAANRFRVRNSTYRSTADVSTWVATNDLKLLAEHGLLIPHGEKRGRYYVASDLTMEIRKQAREARPPLDDPFAEPPQLAMALGR